MVEDRSEDPDLRIPEGSWCSRVGGIGRRRTREASSSILPREDGRWGIIRSSSRECGRWGVLRSSKEEVPPAFPLLPCDLRIIIQGRRSKIGGSSIFGSKDRRLKIRLFQGHVKSIAR